MAATLNADPGEVKAGRIVLNSPGTSADGSTLAWERPDDQIVRLSRNQAHQGGSKPGKRPPNPFGGLVASRWQEPARGFERFPSAHGVRYRGRRLKFDLPLASGIRVIPWFVPDHGFFHGLRDRRHCSRAL